MATPVRSRAGQFTETQLQYFLLVANSRTQVEAAQKLGVTQTNLSIALKRLATHVGFPLFEIKGRALEITEKGRDLRPHVEKFLEAREALTAKMTELANA
jgi:DNA-binding transcriptional LysR family regulator